MQYAWWFRQDKLGSVSKEVLSGARCSVIAIKVRFYSGCFCHMKRLFDCKALIVQWRLIVTKRLTCMRVKSYSGAHLYACVHSYCAYARACPNLYMVIEPMLVSERVCMWAVVDVRVRCACEHVALRVRVCVCVCIYVSGCVYVWFYHFMCSYMHMSFCLHRFNMPFLAKRADKFIRLWNLDWVMCLPCSWENEYSRIKIVYCCSTRRHFRYQNTQENNWIEFPLFALFIQDPLEITQKAS